MKAVVGSGTGTPWPAAGHSVDPAPRAERGPARTQVNGLLVCLCRRHHRLETHAPGWMFAMDLDGTLHVTPPGGRTRTTKPPCIAENDMSTPTHPDTLTDLLGPTPTRFRSPTPEQRAAREQPQPTGPTWPPRSRPSSTPPSPG